MIERLIGSGGMGHVWLARRTDGLYDGRAAIKLMRLASADAVADERFAREGRMLGRLNHPHIAKLLDAGLLPSGERYLVLEFVEGERIDRWCDAHRSTSGWRSSSPPARRLRMRTRTWSSTATSSPRTSSSRPAAM